MNYQALLFCPDEKTARVLTQVLTDLEFRVEPSSEPFAAVKTLMGQRFDAVVVDCENEQNATLLFKSARNSNLNNTALSVAVVEGQAGVAKAFRLGANLVLTKPINVEQSKGTLRVARGLLRKADAARPASETSAAAPVQTPPSFPAPRASVIAPPVPVSAPARVTPAAAGKPAVFPTTTPAPAKTIERQIPAAVSSAFELDPETTPQLDPVEAALLESMPETKLRNQSATGSPSPAKEYAWQTSAKDAVLSAAATQGSAAAVAPAKEVASVPTSSEPAVKSAEAVSIEVPETPADYKSSATTVSQEPALFSTVGSPNDSGSNSKKMLLVAAVVLVAAGGIYFGLTKMRSSHTSVADRPTNATPATSAVSPSGPPVVSAQITASSFPAATPPAVSSAATPVVPAAAKSSAPAAETKAPKAAASKSSDVDAAPDAQAPLMVQGGRMPAPPPTPNTADPDAPAVDVASNNSASALSGIVGSGAVSLPKASGQSLQVSQGVSQGLLVHKVNPVYPRQAQEGHIQGSVQLLATIAEDGSISSVKVLKGDAALASAAADAVKQWKYKPYYLDGQPIAIQTQITLNFKLP